MKQDNFPCIVEVTVDVNDVVAVLEAEVVTVLVAVDVLGSVETVDVPVVVSVV